MAIPNEQMKPNRYLRWARAKRLVSQIQAHLLAGGIVTIGTYTKATHYSKPKYAEMFKVARGSAYVQRGKNWDCIDYCAIRFN